ncbi:MAG: long-chain fatty acid--CoA ligase [Deltaproteobacteria bacterium]|nr:long-chain fatty acid--CoA ligase [Deltaproteobacteria bacterium]
MIELKERTMPAIFQSQVRALGDRACVAYKKNGAYVDISWNEMDKMIRNLGSYLISQGINPGDNVAVFSPNRYEWWVADLAVLSIGAVNVPIYATNSAEEAYYVLDHSEAKMCFAGTPSHLQKVMEVKDRLPYLKNFVIFDLPKEPVPEAKTLTEAMNEGAAQDNQAEFDRRLEAIDPASLATVIYTSGTTGNPKGVMLSHANFVANVDQVLTDFGNYLTGEDTLLSFLPLSHSLERTAGYYLPIGIGAKVAFAEDFSKIQQNMVEVRPTLIISVPRLYEKIHAGILAKVATAGPIKKALFNWAMGLAMEGLTYICHNKPMPLTLSLKYSLADKLIFSKLKIALGFDKLKLAVSGGGPLSAGDAIFFLGMGVIILEGFGLTETTPILTVNRLGMIKPGKVGKAMKDTILTTGEDGELLAKGPQIMLGYYKNEEATGEVFTPDGFFKTGDIAAMDEDGYWAITGRIKDIIVTSGGKNVSPQNIENSLKYSHLIEQVAVIGDRRKYLSALIIPNFEELTKWARENNISFKDSKDLIKNDQVRKLYEQELAEHTKQFARVEQIKKFSLLDSEWTQLTGELTPTLKVKRRVIETKYAKDIESMYPQEIPEKK